jgi:hypothetical protein
MWKKLLRTVSRSLSLDADVALVGDELVVTVSVTYGDLTVLEESFAYEVDELRERLQELLADGRERRLERRAHRQAARA